MQREKESSADFLNGIKFSKLRSDPHAKKYATAAKLWLYCTCPLREIFDDIEYLTNQAINDFHSYCSDKIESKRLLRTWENLSIEEQFDIVLAEDSELSELTKGCHCHRR